MTFTEALGVAGRPGKPCEVKRALGLLLPEDRAMAEDALANPQISDERIRLAFIAKVGHEHAPGRSAIYQHRIGGHVGCPLSTTP